MQDVQFSQLKLAPELLTVVGELGYEKLTAIQALSIPILLQGKDVIGQAKTGSGKTAAFVLPILNTLKPQEKYVQALILCPTRELASQVVAEIRKLGRRLEGLQVVAMVGGQPGREQSIALERGAQIVVGTPGRVADHLDRWRLDLGGMTTLVLDEADKMLEMGFEVELRAIMGLAPRDRQTVFFSATFPETILELSNAYQRKPEKVIVESEELPQIEQFVYECEEDEKENFLMRALQQHPSNSTIIFCNMKVTVNALLEKLQEQGVACGALHGDMEQRERDREMALFRNGSHRILVATDVAARGLDIENLELVINFDFPGKPDVFVHRIGRTGRAGKSGQAVVFANSRDTVRIMDLEKASGRKFLKKPLGFKNQYGLNKSTREAPMKTLSISGGRKDKLRPGDILGALTGTQQFVMADVGKIEIQDRISYVAVSSKVADEALDHLRNSRIKGKKFQIRFVEK